MRAFPPHLLAIPILTACVIHFSTWIASCSCDAFPLDITVTRETLWIVHSVHELMAAFLIRPSGRYSHIGPVQFQMDQLQSPRAPFTADNSNNRRTSTGNPPPLTPTRCSSVADQLLQNE